MPMCKATLNMYNNVMDYVQFIYYVSDSDLKLPSISFSKLYLKLIHVCCSIQLEMSYRTG